jgi:hypothetical protein
MQVGRGGEGWVSVPFRNEHFRNANRNFDAFAKRIRLASYFAMSAGFSARFFLLGGQIPALCSAAKPRRSCAAYLAGDD